MPKAPSTRSLARLAVPLVGTTWFLLVFGASVRVHGAGLACPDWPLCFGEVIPPIDFGVGLEFGHRVLAGLISLAFLGLVAGIVARRRELGRGMVALAAFACTVLAVQVVLGGLTVLELLAEWTVTSHLLAGNTFCLSLLLLALFLRDADRPVVRAHVSWSWRLVAVAVALLVSAQMVLGGLIASSNAGLVCPDWPTCAGDVWVPTWQGLVGLQVVHRIVAYSLLAAAAIAVLATRGRGRAGRVALGLFVIVLFQGAVGVANVLLRLPVEVTLLHSFGAAGVVLATTWLNYEVWRAPLAAPSLASSPVEVP